MKTLSLKEFENDSTLFDRVEYVLKREGLVCVPCGGNYRILADLTSKSAVTKLLQSKRRTHKAPSLVFISDSKMLAETAINISPIAKKMAVLFWPGPLTILFDANPDLPSKVVKPLIKANGKLGIRIPDHPFALKVVKRFGRPLLVSSANKQKKAGAGSPAQVRKNFSSRIDLFIDAGDLPPASPSTVVDFQKGVPKIIRPGAIPEDEIAQAYEL